MRLEDLSYPSESRLLMSKYTHTCPLTQRQLVDEYFIEYRAQVLAVAAFLDRLDRAAERDAEGEFRYQAFREAVAALTSGEAGRAERVQMILSDPRLELLEERDQQSAFGAFDRASLNPNQGDGHGQ